MNRVIAYDILTGKPSVWLVPSLELSKKNAKETWGTQYDPVEEEWVVGCIPLRLHKAKR